MKRLLTFLFPLLAAAALVGTQARADMCGGGGQPRPLPPDAGKDSGALNLRKFPRQLGAGFLFAACLSSGWLCFRRKDPGGKP